MEGSERSIRDEDPESPRPDWISVVLSLCEMIGRGRKRYEGCPGSTLGSERIRASERPSATSKSPDSPLHFPHRHRPSAVGQLIDRQLGREVKTNSNCSRICSSLGLCDVMRAGHASGCRRSSSIMRASVYKEHQQAEDKDKLRVSE